MPPFKDETTRSWIVRNALFFGMRPSSFASYCFEDNGTTWRADIDVRLSEAKLKLLVQNTEVAEHKLKKLPLMNSCDNFYSPTGKSPHIKWVMPTGVRTERTCYGVQYCACCLLEDGAMPYFRKYWRLGFFSSCLFHGVQLNDRCPSCKSPIKHLRFKKHTEQLLYHPEDIAFCNHCSFDLRKTEVSFSTPEETQINQWHFHLYQLGYGSAGNLFFQYSYLYFEGIRRLLSFIVSDPMGEIMFKHYRDKLELNYPYHRALIPRHSEIEFMDIKARRTGLLIIKNIIDEWPHGFIEAAKATDVSTQFFNPNTLYFPYWVIDVLKFNLNKDPIRFSAAEHKNAQIILERKLGRKLKPYEIMRFINKLYSNGRRTYKFNSLNELRARKDRGTINLNDLSIVLRRQLRLVCMNLYRKGMPPSQISSIYGIKKLNIWNWKRRQPTK